MKKPRKSSVSGAGKKKPRTTGPAPTKRRKSRRAKEISDAVAIKKAAGKSLAEAERLFRKSRQSDGKADQPRRSIGELHLKAGLAKVPVRVPTGEGAELVVEEKDGEQGLPFPIVGIGASAGGFEAFTDFLTALPRETGMAFIFIQHLDPKHKSRLTDLLAHSSKIPVLEAENNLEVVPNHIYVIPEATTMAIEGGLLRLTPRKEHELPPMPIDYFFRSLAKEQRERAIGVVLSGTGSDGTLGLEALKGEGGITFAQDEHTAKYVGMPGSAIASGAVDFVLSPTDIAQELGRIAGHPYLGRVPPLPKDVPTTTELEKLMHDGAAALSALFNLLRARTGVDFSLYKQSTLRRRIIRRMVLHKIETLQEYVALVQGNAAEIEGLFKDLLINVTSFFRDPLTFQILKRKIFPRILKAHTGQSPLRFWVCGCASGEEAYSLAIVLVEFFEQTSVHRQAQVFATDVSESSIEKARAGVYPENIQQDVSPQRLRRFFKKTNGNYQVDKSIRDMCIFASQNLVVDPPFSNLDLVTCRNVLIYFGPVLQRRIIPLFHYSLLRTGFLVLGNSETIGSSTDYFGLIDKRHKIYLKRPHAARPGFDLGRKSSDPEPKHLPGPVERSSPDPKLMDLHQQVDRILLRDFSPAAVVINSDLEVIHFRGRTGDYLEHAPGNASLNLLKMARERLSLGLRAALTRAMKQYLPVRQPGVELRFNHQVREINLEVIPFRLGLAQERLYLVVFKEPETLPAAEGAVRPGAASGGKGGATQKREVAKLRHQLIATKESVQSIIEEQEATNEELKSANEEIQSSNEELQSTNEELETAKEELQSTNEELSTLNEELQNRNAELSQLNNDLTNLLASVNVAIIMLGSDLTIRRFTPLAERIFNLIPADAGRRLSDLSRAILIPNLDALVQEVIDNLTPVEREAQDRDGHWYLLRIRPYRTRENKIDGAVILLVDIDEMRRVVDALISATTQPLLILGIDASIRKANEAFCAFFGVKLQELADQNLYEAYEGQWNLPELRKLVEDTAREGRPSGSIELQVTFPRVGLRRLRITSRRFFQESRGMQLLLLGFEELSG
ncbi:MAG TPA: chemotaxis protein CheB [Verrucomicrobiae bacterium]|nr:chemotaxis protein CheB [Verrucomicrobiae bacterium]